MHSGARGRIFRRCSNPRFLLILTLLPLLNIAARSDEIKLTNGRTMWGIISRETDSHIVLELGVGSTRIDRTRIDSIRRSSPDEQAQIRSDWGERYFLNRKYVPAQLADLASGYKTLLSQRDEASRATRSLSEAKRIIHRESRVIETTRTQLADISRQLKAATPNENMQKYNLLVRNNNSLTAKITLSQEKIRNTEKRLAHLSQAVSGYINSLADFTIAFRKRQNASHSESRTKTEESFFNRLEWKIAELNGELTQTVAPAIKKGGALQVAAILNEAITETMIIDTGASLVSIPEATAKRLGIDLDGLPVQTLVLADGRKVEGKTIVLKSVRVGDASAGDVPAVIIPSHPGSTADSLLGMSFLSNFAIHIDGATGNLLLSSFAPR